MNTKLIVLVFAMMLMIGAAFLRSNAAAQSAPANQTGGPKPVSGQNAGVALKNLQVLTELKDAPQNELFSTMDFISGSLSVSCSYCHVTVNGAATQFTFDSDAKKTKLIARDMIKMTRAINETNFGGHPVVTCNTCHQGSAHPNGVPTPWNKTPEQIAAYNKSVQAAGQPEPATAASPTTLPDAAAVIANYRKAVGADALKTLNLKGTNSHPLIGTEAAHFEISAIFPDKVRLRQSDRGLSTDALFNAEGAWIIPSQGAAQPVPSRNPSRQTVDLFLPLRDTKASSPQRVTGIEKIGPGNYYVVLSQAGKSSERFYFDVQSGLLYKDRNETETVLGTSVSETTFEDYHDVSGVKIPYKITTHFMGNEFFAQISDAKANIDVDPKQFESPPERKSIKLDPKILDAYLGEYQLTPTTVLTFTREGDRFLLNQPTGPQMEVFAESETEFFLKAIPAQITFVKNAQGQVTHLVLHQPGRDREMKKVK